MSTGSALGSQPSAATRRGFLQRMALVPALLPCIASGSAHGAPSGQVRFGLIADIHPDMLPDGLNRVQSFIAAMKEARVDFILQLGDFCWPAPSNLPYLKAWREYQGPAYHVLGNHDMDDGYTREQTVAFCGMPGMHYTFDAGPVRGIVLDGNEPGGNASGYRRFVGAEQLRWLERELQKADRPCLLFIHQPFDADLPDYIENAPAVREVVERAQQKRPGSVVAVFCGHLHLDYERVVNGVRYIQINSAAYWWLNNAAARRETYAPEVHQKFRYLTHVAAYRDPLWSVVTLDFERGELILEGRRSEWVGPDPWSRGETTDRPREQLHPWISDRQFKFRA
jgi:hypothetical protein